MTILEIEAIATSSHADDDPNVDHLVCHCRKHDVAWCGLNVAEVPFVGDDSPTPLCPLCALAAERPSCPWGCICSECGCLT